MPKRAASPSCDDSSTKSSSKSIKSLKLKAGKALNVLKHKASKITKAIQKKKQCTERINTDGNNDSGLSKIGVNNPQKQKQNAVIELDNSDEESQMGSEKNTKAAESNAELGKYSFYETYIKSHLNQRTSERGLEGTSLCLLWASTRNHLHWKPKVSWI